MEGGGGCPARLSPLWNSRRPPPRGGRWGEGVGARARGVPCARGRARGDAAGRGDAAAGRAAGAAGAARAARAARRGGGRGGAARAGGGGRRGPAPGGGRPGAGRLQASPREGAVRGEQSRLWQYTGAWEAEPQPYPTAAETFLSPPTVPALPLPPTHLKKNAAAKRHGGGPEPSRRKSAKRAAPSSPAKSRRYLSAPPQLNAAPDAPCLRRSLSMPPP